MSPLTQADAAARLPDAQAMRGAHRLPALLNSVPVAQRALRRQEARVPARQGDGERRGHVRAAGGGAGVHGGVLTLCAGLARISGA